VDKQRSALTVGFRSQLTCQRLRLARVLVPYLLVIGNRNGRRKLLKGERADAHARVKRDGHNAQVAEFERGVASPTRIKESRRAVHDDADTAQTGATFEASQDVVIQFEAFLRDGKRKLSRLQYEGFIRLYVDGAHKVLNGAFLPDIDVGMPAMFKDAELRAEAEIDGATAKLLRRKGGRNFDLALLEVAPDIDVGKNHGDAGEQPS